MVCGALQFISTLLKQKILKSCWLPSLKRPFLLLMQVRELVLSIGFQLTLWKTGRIDSLLFIWGVFGNLLYIKAVSTAAAVLSLRRG